MPASPSTNWKKCEELESQFDGETKYEKAYWQVYGAIINNQNSFVSWDKLAEVAIAATDAGLKALDTKD